MTFLQSHKRLNNPLSFFIIVCQQTTLKYGIMFNYRPYNMYNVGWVSLLIDFPHALRSSAVWIKSLNKIKAAIFSVNYASINPILITPYTLRIHVGVYVEITYPCQRKIIQEMSYKFPKIEKKMLKRI